jgi:hypothetical protein
MSSEEYIGLDVHQAPSEHRSSRVRVEGWRQWLTRPEKNLVQRKNKRTHLTPTGFHGRRLRSKPLARVCLTVASPSDSKVWKGQVLPLTAELKGLVRIPSACSGDSERFHCGEY